MIQCSYTHFILINIVLLHAFAVMFDAFIMFASNYSIENSRLLVSKQSIISLLIVGSKLSNYLNTY